MKTIDHHLKDAELWIKCARRASRDHGPIEALWRLGQAEVSLNLAKRELPTTPKPAPTVPSVPSAA